MWELDHKEDWVPKDWSFWTVMLEKTLQSSLDCKKMKPVNSKGNQPWIFIGRTDAEADAPILWPTWCEELTHLKRPWGWERLKAGGEGDDRGDGWIVSVTEWLWVWTSSGRWWRTVKPSVLQSMGSQRVGLNWVTEQQSFMHIHRSGSNYRCISMYVYVCMFAILSSNEPTVLQMWVSKYQTKWGKVQVVPRTSWTDEMRKTCQKDQDPA